MENSEGVNVENKNTEQSDPWTDALSKHLEELSKIIEKALTPWREAKRTKDPEALKIAAQEFSVPKTVTDLKLKLREIEKWYQEQYNDAVKDVSASLNAHPNKWMLNAQSSHFLTEKTASQMDSIEKSFSDFKKAALDFAMFAEHKTCLGKLKNLGGTIIKAINLDPNKSLSNIRESGLMLIGKDKISEEYKRLETQLKQAEVSLSDAKDALIESVKLLLVDNRNDNLQDLADKIKEGVQHRYFWRKVLISISAILLLVGGWWVYHLLKGRTETSVSVSQVGGIKNEFSETITVPAGSKLRQGPGESFPIIFTIESPTTANIIDKTVPGWVKIQTALGVQGWIGRKK